LFVSFYGCSTDTTNQPTNKQCLFFGWLFSDVFSQTPQKKNKNYGLLGCNQIDNIKGVKSAVLRP